MRVCLYQILHLHLYLKVTLDFIFCLTGLLIHVAVPDCLNMRDFIICFNIWYSQPPQIHLLLQDFSGFVLFVFSNELHNCLQGANDIFIGLALN